MAHVRTQLRKGVQARLATVAALSGVHDESRIVRGFQQDDFPLALVGVTETVSGVSDSQGQRVYTRGMSVSIRLCVEDDVENAEDALDGLAVAVEKALLKSSDLGVGKLQQWRLANTSPVTPVAVSEGYMLSQTLTYSCDVMTADSTPETNLLS